MAHSMTAFSRIEISNDHGNYNLEMRSINSRFLEINLRLPEVFSPLEMVLRELLKKHFTRGKIDNVLRFTQNIQDTKLDINTKRAQEIINATKNIANLAGCDLTINPLEILNFEGVLQIETPDIEQLHKFAISLFEQAIIKLQESRRREGKQLSKFIVERLNLILDSLETLEVFLPQMSDALRTKILQRADDLKVKIDPLRLEQEIVLMLQKTDVAEEIERLKTHITEFKRILNSSSAIGRKLDFLLQELVRETNTLGAKAFDMRTTNVAIDIKVWVEQIREQVQNIE